MDVDGPEPQADEAFDLEAYAAQYSGHAKIDRLLFIADRSAGRPAELEALKLAAAELKASTQNTLKYAEVIERIGGRAGLEFAPDREWMESVDRQAAMQQDRLEGELASFKTNLVKESIRLGHIDLGAFCYRRGDLLSAFKNYMRARDYCTAPAHVLGMCLAVIRTSIELGNYMHVTNYVQKAEAALETQPDPLVRAKLAAASGLNLLEQGRYKLAARKFADVSPDLGTSYNDVIALQDVAMYGALAGMASLDRPELRSQLLDNVGFRELLDLVPEVRDALGDFYGSRYTACLARLDRLRPQLALDIHLHDHAAALYQAIRNKALVQYTTPFAALDLNAMAAAFNTGVGGLEEELAALIGSREIAARIDSHAKVLYAKKLNQRGSTYQQALRAGEEYLASTKALLLRASILQHDLIQKPIGGGPGGPGGPDRPDGPPGRPGRRHGGGGEHRPGRRGGGPRGGGSGGSGASGSGGRGEDEGGREERAGGFFAAMLGRVAGGGGI